MKIVESHKAQIFFFKTNNISAEDGFQMQLAILLMVATKQFKHFIILLHTLHLQGEKKETSSSFKKHTDNRLCC